MGKTEEDVRIVLIHLRYARQKIEHIENTLKQSSAFSAGELRANIDSAINTLKIAKVNIGPE
jgi:5-bromo-4-chloroindolyl phosphate hydrolysis protein